MIGSVQLQCSDEKWHLAAVLTFWCGGVLLQHLSAFIVPLTSRLRLVKLIGLLALRFLLVLIRLLLKSHAADVPLVSRASRSASWNLNSHLEQLMEQNHFFILAQLER
jgi:hypothetical protein